jgi:hypothetical protein
MSRVDDDRDEARIAARIAEQRRAEESRKKDKTAQDSQFAKLVGAQKEQVQRTDKDMSARSAIAHLLETSESDSKGEAGQLEQKANANDSEARGFRARMGSKALGEKVSSNSRADGQRSQETKLASDQGRADTSHSRTSDQANARGTNQSRQSDAKTGRDVQSDRAASSDKSKAAQEGGAAPEKGDLKADADKGGQGGNQGSGSDKKSDVPAGFRFNPALMAPVPVAKKNDIAGSDRLRRIAAEIAQKIVERVRIGTNALGNAEFQIDMRDNVLGGMTVKISAKNGKISAVFSGRDKDVLKMLEEQEESLKGALSARGLTLEKFKVEART